MPRRIHAFRIRPPLPLRSRPTSSAPLLLPAPRARWLNGAHRSGAQLFDLLIRFVLDFIRGRAAFFLCDQEARLSDFFLFRLGRDRSEFFLHLLKRGALDDGVRLRFKEGDLTLRRHHPLIKGRVSPEPTYSVDVAFFCGHLVKEANETAGIVPGIPGVLYAELVG